MRYRLNEAELLEVWERGQGRSGLEQALAPLSCLLPELRPDDLAQIPLGERDGTLLRLRQATLGDTLHGSVPCPRCRRNVDFAVAVTDVLSAGDAGRDLPDRLEVAGCRLRLRPLDSRDLAWASSAGSLAEARQRLLERLVVAAEQDGQAVSPAALPPAAIAAACDWLEALDPLCLVPLALQCNHCGHAWQPLLEAASFVWRELETRAERLMYDVHDLAQLYGWSEPTILALSPARRQFYLGLAPSEAETPPDAAAPAAGGRR
jgi:hypothetical protein